MKQIYIILTYTGTALAKVIKTFTRDEFAHVSIALDKELQQMYSFGRLNPYNPFIGGFVHEGIQIGTFKRFKNTTSAIYSMSIDDKQYEKIKKTIKVLERGKTLYDFNVIGLFAAGFHIRIRRTRSFYCAEFVKYIMDKANIENNLPDTVKPEDFKKLDMKLEYRGRLRDYA